ncbi:MAG: hypothetical protein KGO49_10355 [Gammaproteobacteria bacterium]|nr:hypothetical protein [Gammaproteobacteria bacterium]
MMKIKILTFAISALLVHSTGYAEDLFDFTVENNLPLFKNTKDAIALKKVAMASTKYFSTEVNTNALIVESPWKNQSKLPETYFNKDPSSYDRNFIFPSDQVIILNTNNFHEGDQCQWSIDGKEINEHACQNVQLSIPFTVRKPTYYEAQADIKLTINSSATSTISKTIITRDYIIAGLGDSYSSGEGTPDIPNSNKKKVQWFFGNDKRRCDRSLLSWPSLVTARLAAGDPKNSYRFISRACSGALIEDVGSESTFDIDDKGVKKHISKKWGRERNTPLSQSQVQTLSKDLTNLDMKREPSLILLSAGGNDAHFGEIIRKAATRNVTIKTKKGLDLKPNIKSNLASEKKFISAALPSMAIDITKSFPNSKIIQAIYPDPLHRDYDHYCIGGVKVKGNTTRYFASKALRIKYYHTVVIPFFQIPNRQQNPIYSDFIVPLTGSTREPPYADESSIGMRQWSNQIAAKNPNWNVLVTRKNHGGSGDSPYDTYFVHGYCVPLEINTDGTPISSYAGPWINNVNDSWSNQHSLYGVVHPNIYGQLYFVYRVFKDFDLSKLIQ